MFRPSDAYHAFCAPLVADVIVLSFVRIQMALCLDPTNEDAKAQLAAVVAEELAAPPPTATPVSAAAPSAKAPGKK